MEHAKEVFASFLEGRPSIAPGSTAKTGLDGMNEVIEK